MYTFTTNTSFSLLFVTEGPCLIHTMLGDLLRSLDPPPLCTDPQSLLINREGYITCVYNSTHVCLYNLNGRPLLHNDTKTSIKVRALLI